MATAEAPQQYPRLPSTADCDVKLISIDSEPQASTRHKRAAFTAVREVKLISVDSASSTPSQEAQPAVASASSSSSSGSGLPLPQVITPGNTAPSPALSPPLRPHRFRDPRPGATIESLLNPAPTGMASIPRMRFENLASDRPMPRDPEYVTMDTIIDQFYVPDFFAKNPAARRSERLVKSHCIERFKARHTRLAIRIENWRQKVTSEDDKYLMRERSKKGFGEDGFHVWARMTHHSNMIERRARDMTNLTDFVNGRAEGLERGRLICWPVLISAKIYQVWFEARVIDEEHAVELHRTDSVEELDSLDDLREHERFRTHGDVDAITGHLLD